MFLQVIETAFTALKQSSTYSFYRKKAWEVIHCYLAASLNLNDDKQILLKLFTYPRYIIEFLFSKFNYRLNVFFFSVSKKRKYHTYKGLHTNRNINGQEKHIKLHLQVIFKHIVIISLVVINFV